ncbi:MAG: N-acetylmuramoyl-L-alanine amidase [Deltaproteobacteria bacterium]|nr:N-acetylmuramoyl-L-alanine amidase [Deltaproteobacteria bacterium]
MRSADLEVWIGQNKRTINSLRRQRQDYYPLNDIADIVALELMENGEVLTIAGSRGNLQLVNGRPLVRFDAQYILLAAPVWKRAPNNWYVSEDFLSKALPLLVNRRFSKVSDMRYRVEATAENPVQVKVSNYPDRVRVVFQSSLNAPIQVREFKDYIQVAFDQFLVRPEFSAIPPDRRLVSSVDFDSSNIYGTFRIHKGDLYNNFRQLTLTAPVRKVIDIYGPPNMSKLGPDSEPDPPEESLSGGSEPPPSPQEPEYLITIDPGHGGGDLGVNSPEGIAEKHLTLRISRRIGNLLTERGHKGMLTRTRDVDLAVEQRGSVGNYYRSQVYLSIHVGGSPSPKTRGPVVYLHKYSQNNEPVMINPNQEGASFFSPRQPPPPTFENGDKLVRWEEGQKPYLGSSRKLAELLQEELNLLWGVENRVAEVPLAGLAPVTAPAVLIEMGFLTNSEDYQRLSSMEFQEQVARTITSAVDTFLQEESLE